MFALTTDSFTEELDRQQQSTLALIHGRDAASARLQVRLALSLARGSVWAGWRVFLHAQPGTHT